MIGLSLTSVIRYWYYTLCNVDWSTYDLWWFEEQATDLGTKYVNLRKIN